MIISPNGASPLRFQGVQRARFSAEPSQTSAAKRKEMLRAVRIAFPYVLSSQCGGFLDNALQKSLIEQLGQAGSQQVLEALHAFSSRLQTGYVPDEHSYKATLTKITTGIQNLNRIPDREVQTTILEGLSNHYFVEIMTQPLRIGAAAAILLDREYDGDERATIAEKVLNDPSLTVKQGVWELLTRLSGSGETDPVLNDLKRKLQNIPKERNFGLDHRS